MQIACKLGFVAKSATGSNMLTYLYTFIYTYIPTYARMYLPILYIYNEGTRNSDSTTMKATNIILSQISCDNNAWEKVCDLACVLINRRCKLARSCESYS